MCHNPSLELMTKARAYKGVGQKWSLGVTFRAPRSVGSVREWTPTLPSEFQLWKLESQWTLESLENDCKRQNSLDLRITYTIQNLLERRCLKWFCITHLDT
jgi:hypothetical protein